MEIHGEPGDACSNIVGLCRCSLPGILEKYILENIYNSYRSSLLFCQLPTRLLIRQ